MTGKPRLPILLASIMVVALALATRGPAPFKLGLINDEQHHLESWRNRYRTDDIYPLFLERLRATNRLRGEKLALVERVYHSSPVVQRGLICLVDPQPPVFPVFAEVVEAVTHSSLIAIRIPSMLASLGSIWLMYRIGRHLRDATLGLWLAGLNTIAFLPITMSGFGRPYAVTQCALLATLFAFLRQRRAPEERPRNLLLVALLTQCLQWMTWSIVGPLVLLDLYLRRRAGAPVKQLVRQSWWYFAISAVVLLEMFVQLLNPTISQQGGVRSAGLLWKHFSLASPFAELAGVDARLLHLAGGLFALLIVVGLGVLGMRKDHKETEGQRKDLKSFFAVFASLRSLSNSSDDDQRRSIAHVALILATLLGLFAAVFIGSREPFWMTYGLPATIAAGVGAHALFRRASPWVLLGVLAVFAPVILAKPADPYDYFYPQDTPYAPVAQTLRENMRPGDRWLSTPYSIGNNLYRYGPLPEPIFPQTDEQLARFLRERDPAVNLFVLTWTQRLPMVTQFEHFDRQWTFRNNVTLVRLPARNGAAASTQSAGGK